MVRVPGGEESGWRLPGGETPHLVTSRPPELGGIRSSLSTYQTAKELIQSARNRILVFFYAVHEGGEDLVGELARRRLEGLQVTACLPEETGAIQTFLDLWNQPRNPKVLTPNRDRWPEGNLHGKAIVADRDRALVTSANLTGWATDTNLEFGVLAGRKVASELDDLYKRLVERELLVSADSL